MTLKSIKKLPVFKVVVPVSDIAHGYFRYRYSDRTDMWRYMVFRRDKV
jgi:hypothetical protein